MWWHTVTRGRGSEGGNWRLEWVASTLHTTSEHGVSSITTTDAHTSVASSRLNWRTPADLNGLVRFAERRNLVSARVPSHFNWPLPVHLLAQPTAHPSLLYRKVTRRFCITYASHNVQFRWPASSTTYTFIHFLPSHNIIFHRFFKILHRTFK